MRQCDAHALAAHLAERVQPVALGPGLLQHLPQETTARQRLVEIAVDGIGFGMMSGLQRLGMTLDQGVQTVGEGQVILGQRPSSRDFRFKRFANEQGIAQPVQLDRGHKGAAAGKGFQQPLGHQLLDRLPRRGAAGARGQR